MGLCVETDGLGKRGVIIIGQVILQRSKGLQVVRESRRSITPLSGTGITTDPNKKYVCIGSQNPVVQGPLPSGCNLFCTDLTSARRLRNKMTLGVASVGR